MDTPEIATFDVLAAAKGRTYPTKDVTIYTDHEAAHQIAVLERQANDAMHNDDVDIDAIDEQINALREQVKASALTFHMRGIGPGVRTSVEMKIKQTTGLSETERVRLSNASYLAEHIVRVTNAAGAVNEEMWTPEKVSELLDVIPDESAIKLYKAMAELTFQASYFDAAVDADFLSKS